MFRLQNNVPSVYTKESRDFQLMCRLYDFLFNGVKFDINSIIEILDAMKINDRLLSLLGTKLGFFTKKQYDSKTLRYVLNAFPYIMKYKGTKKGIELAVSTILRLEGNTETPYVEIINNSLSGEHIYEIYIITEQQEIESKIMLQNILEYIIPLGYVVNIHYGQRYTPDITQSILNTESDYDKLIANSSTISSVYDSQNHPESGMANKYVSTYFSSEIIGSENYREDNNNG